MTKTNEKKLRYEKLKIMIQELESAWEVKLWKRYMDLTGQEKKRLNELWDQYYVDVRNTKAYKRAQKVKEMVATGAISQAVDLGKEARADMESGKLEINKPSEHDPVGLVQLSRVRRYVQFKDEFQKLSNDSTGYDIW